MKSVVIPYLTFGAVSRPVIKTWLQNGNQITPFETYSIIDSGADNCCFPSSFAKHIGIDLKTIQETTTEGATGSGKSYIYPVDVWIELDGKRQSFHSKVLFIDNLGTGLLGRAGFFNLFAAVTFLEKRKVAVLTL